MSNYTPGTGHIVVVQLQAYEVALPGSTAVITRRGPGTYWTCTEHGKGECDHVAEYRLHQYKAQLQAAKSDEARQAELHAKAAHLVDGRIVPPTTRP
jgi:hypothetical protein